MSRAIGRWGSVPLSAFRFLTKKQLAVYAVIASCQGTEGKGVPRQKKIREGLLDAGYDMSTNAISKHVNRLKNLGWLGVTRRGWGQSNTYVILNPTINGEYVKPAIQNGDMESPQGNGASDSPPRDGDIYTTPSTTPFVQDPDPDWMIEAEKEIELERAQPVKVLVQPEIKPQARIVPKEEVPNATGLLLLENFRRNQRIA